MLNKLRTWVLIVCLIAMVTAPILPRAAATAHAQVAEPVSVEQVPTGVAMEVTYPQTPGATENEKVFVVVAAEVPVEMSYLSIPRMGQDYISMLCGAEPADGAVLSNMMRVPANDAPQGDHVYEPINRDLNSTVSCAETATVPYREKELSFSARVLGGGTAHYSVTITYASGEVLMTLSAPQVQSSGWIRFFADVPATTERLFVLWSAEGEGVSEGYVQMDNLRMVFDETRAHLPTIDKMTLPPPPAMPSGHQGRWDSPNQQLVIAREHYLVQSDVTVVSIQHEGRIHNFYYWPEDPSYVQYYNTDGSVGDFVQMMDNAKRSTILVTTLALMAPNVTAQSVGTGIRIVGTIIRGGVVIATLVELSTAAALLAPVGVILFVGYVAYQYGGNRPSAWKPLTTYGGFVVGYQIHWVASALVETHQALYVYRAQDIRDEHLESPDIVSLVSTGQTVSRTLGYVLSTSLLANQTPLSEDPIPYSLLELAKIVVASGDWFHTEVQNENGTVGRKQLWLPQDFGAFSKPYYLSEVTGLAVQYYDNIIARVDLANGQGIAIVDTPIPGVTFQTTVTHYVVLSSAVRWMVTNAVAMPRDMPQGPDRDERLAYITALLLATLQAIQIGRGVDIPIPREETGDARGKCLNKVDLLTWRRGILDEGDLLSSNQFYRAVLNAVATGEVTYNRPLAARWANDLTEAQLHIVLPDPQPVDPEMLGGNNEDVTERDTILLHSICKQERGRPAHWSEAGVFWPENLRGAEIPLPNCYDRPRNFPTDHCGI